MNELARSDESTCLNLNLSSKVRCVTCNIVFDRTRKTATRQPCERRWDEKYKNHQWQSLHNRYIAIWDEINNPQKDSLIEGQANKRAKRKKGPGTNIKCDGIVAQQMDRRKRKKVMMTKEGNNTGTAFCLAYNLPESSGKANKNETEEDQDNEQKKESVASIVMNHEDDLRTIQQENIPFNQLSSANIYDNLNRNVAMGSIPTSDSHYYFILKEMH